MRKTSIFLPSLTALAMASCLPAMAHAQAAPGQAGAQTGTRTQAESEPAAPGPGDAGTTQAQADAQPGDGDIIVTAQKRAERLQDVPLAVTAVGGDALAARQINDSASLVAAVPSLTYTQGANPTNTTFRVRGIGTQLFGQGVESSVSVVVDGVVNARQAQGFADLADIERVEVLRGPQGTLFGRNATAGVINVVTARPSREFGGRADFTIAEHDEYRARGTVTGPLSDTLRARLTGFYNNVGGYVRNVTTGRDVQGSKSWGARGKLEWDASEDLNILFSADYAKTNATCCASVPYRITNPTLLALYQPIGAINRRTRRLVENADTYNNTWQFTGSVQANLDLGSATLTSITAFQKYHLDNNQPIDRSDSDPVLYLGPTTATAFASWDLNGGEVDLKQFSQELRVSSDGSSAVNYVFGAFYSHVDIERPFERRRQLCVAGTLLQPCAAANIRNQSGSSIARLKTDSIAVFGQLEPRIVGGLSGILGLRAQHESGRNVGTQRGTVVAGDIQFPGQTFRAAGPNTGFITSEDSVLTGKAGLKYEFSRQAQTYATYTRGYKGQGYDMEAGTDFTAQTILQPEYVDAYELGAKFSTADRLLSLNVALFQADYSNLQVQANRSDPATGVIRFVSVNAGESQTRGVELEGTLRPVEGLDINFGATYAKSKVSINGLNCALQDQPGAPVVTGTTPFNSCYRTVAGGTPQQNLREVPLPNSPRWRYTIAPRFDRPIEGTGLAGFVQANVNYQSRVNFAIEQDPLQVQRAYTLVDLSLGVRDADDRWNLTFFVKNLFDKNYFTSTTHTVLLQLAARTDMQATFNKDADRYLGATFGVRF